MKTLRTLNSFCFDKVCTHSILSAVKSRESLKKKKGTKTKISCSIKGVFKKEKKKKEQRKKLAAQSGKSAATGLVSSPAAGAISAVIPAALIVALRTVPLTERCLTVPVASTFSITGIVGPVLHEREEVPRGTASNQSSSSSAWQIPWLGWRRAGKSQRSAKSKDHDHWTTCHRVAPWVLITKGGRDSRGFFLGCM